MLGSLFYDHWTYDPDCEIPDLAGKVAIVTGVSEETIGHYTAQLLAVHGCKVYVVSRNEQKTRHCMSLIEKAHPKLRDSGLLVFHPLDQSSCVKSKESAEAFLSKEKRLDILVNNAGRLAFEYALTPEGIEESVATNHVGQFVFTTSLLPLIKATAKMPHSDVRILIHSSRGAPATVRYEFASLADFNDIGTSNSFLGRVKRYSTTKFMNLLFMFELQARLDAEHIPVTVISLHPGAVQSGSVFCFFHSASWLLTVYTAAGISPYEGAFTTLFAATSAEVAAQRERYKARFLLPYGRIVDVIPQARDPELARLLWETTECCNRCLREGVSDNVTYRRTWDSSATITMLHAVEFPT
ncbi:NAD-P-binding protein [Amylostereum chailletii]|nr:NAD-P-binding protein [Amylostereum chailletii]